jgi:hypothetical protein
VLAFVLTGTHDESARNVSAPGKGEPPTEVAQRDMPADSLDDNKGTEPNEDADTAGDLKVENRNTGIAAEKETVSSKEYSSAGSTGSNSTQESPLLEETDRFRSSASVQERCRTRPAPTPDSCVAMSKFLEELAREERDVEWATQTEARIRAVVATRQDGTQIRALECRFSKCAIETESPGTQDHLSILMQAEQEAAGVVDDGNYVLAWEEDDVRGTLTITERAFTRRIQ